VADSEFYIYVLFRETGVPFYVGKGKGNRWLHHERKTPRRPSHKDAIIRKMLAAGHEIPKVILHANLTEDVAFAYEMALIAAIGRVSKGLGPLTNQTDGGEGVSGWKVTPERLASMAAIKLGTKHSPEIRAKIGAAHRGKKYTPEQRARISAAKTGHKHSAEVRANMSRGKLGNKNTLGYKHSAETRAKLSIARLGNKNSVGRKLSAETIAKRTASSRLNRLARLVGAAPDQSESHQANTE